MGLLDKLAKNTEKKQEEIQVRQEDYMNLIKVYLQAVIISEPKFANLNINSMPELRMFKSAMRIPTQGHIGIAEKKMAKDMLNSKYGLSDTFCKDIDKSVRRVCVKTADLQKFFLLFQNLTMDLTTVLSNQLQWKARIPSFFRGLIKSSVSDAVKDIMTKSDWTAPDIFQACQRIRKTSEKMNLSQKWMADFFFPLIMISKGAKVVK